MYVLVHTPFQEGVGFVPQHFVKQDTYGTIILFS